VTGRGLLHSLGDDLARHWRHVAAGGAGIAVSVAALVFFLGLGLGLRDTLLGEIFPVDRVEVTRTATDLNLLAVTFELGKDTLDAEDLERLGRLNGVTAIYPKMRLLVPALASGGESLLGTGMQTELVADGVDPSLVTDEVGEAFHDPRIDPSNLPSDCSANAACPPGTVCVGASAFGPGACREEIPVIVSRQMVELYNGAFRRAYRLPKLNPDALVGFGLEVRFGASSLFPSSRRAVTDRAKLVGFSDAAIPLGITMPLGFVRRLNRELGPPGSSDGYHSAVLQLSGAEVAPAVVEQVEALGLEVRDRGARRAASLMATVLAVVAVVGIVVLAVSALHVMHVFALLTVIRRREIAVMRAVGASRGDIRWLLVIEAAVVGLAAGAVGLAAAVVLGRVADRAVATGLPDLPFAPGTLFAFPGWLLAGGLAVAAVACVLGALGPVLLATAADPVDGLGDG
jgi:putative ABC transport system permease protein